MVPTDSPTKWFVFPWPALLLPRSIFTDCCHYLVTPGNRGAAVVTGLNVIVFSTIAILAHREKKRKAGNTGVEAGTPVEESSTPSSLNGDEHVDEKRTPYGVKAVEL